MATCPSSSAGRHAVRGPSPRRRASRLIDTGRPLRTSNTRTPTGEVSIRASRSARARCSARWVRASATAVSRLRGEEHEHLLVLCGELGAGLLLAEEEGADLHAAMAHRRPPEGLDHHPVGGQAERGDLGGMSATRSGDGTSRIASKTQKPSDHCSTCCVSSGVKPERTASSSRRAPSMVATRRNGRRAGRGRIRRSRASTVSTSRLALMRRMAAESASVRAAPRSPAPVRCCCSMGPPSGSCTESRPARPFDGPRQRARMARLGTGARCPGRPGPLCYVTNIQTCGINT